jgi:hypothetical protein
VVVGDAERRRWRAFVRRLNPAASDAACDRLWLELAPARLRRRVVH